MGRTYLLDTNIISYLTDPQSPYRAKVKERLFSLSEDDSVAVSILTLYELTRSTSSHPLLRCDA